MWIVSLIIMNIWRSAWILQIIFLLLKARFWNSWPDCFPVITQDLQGFSTRISRYYSFSLLASVSFFFFFAFILCICVCFSMCMLVYVFVCVRGILHIYKTPSLKKGAEKFWTTRYRTFCKKKVKQRV